MTLKRKLLIGVPLTLLGLTGLIGAMHHPAARPLLGWMGVECPQRASPELVEQARLASARLARGTEASPARPALGFRLDHDTFNDVAAWAAERNLDCTSSQNDTVLRCVDVPASAFAREGSQLDDLTFAFAPRSQRLVTVTSLRQRLSAEHASASWHGIKDALETELGPGELQGDASAAYLNEKIYRSARVAYRFNDYIANVSVANLGGRVAVREHYMSAAE